MMHFFIGWDERERDAYQVCAHSLLRHASCEVKIHPLKHRWLRKQGLFTRAWLMDEKGQWWDRWDGKPFSTEFSHTRFLVPEIAKREGLTGWAIFCDADFLFLEDVAELQGRLDPQYALMCVQHDYRPLTERKMDGQMQVKYRRKNWSSLMAFNLDHLANNALTPDCVNMSDGGWLHQCGWLSDDQIGGLPKAWNWLVGEMDDDGGRVCALHYTNGGPWLDDWQGGLYDALWRAEFERTKHPTPTTRLKMMAAE